ncbi:CCA tRNA nucleotidyltransferase 1, mitochondrial isoform X1 [Lingula anatina]|uniref:CCA tRNA nucleotidyltransferase 1, mitochondrial isoform X1 n=2 Tax=Lingula anatina TaxID=7574 RepID=A0A1S3I248_LINAN|nr:CCA tRNA nucleotidyltransferase 1, mitochondrial isoform X1 [Lingula anatina]XP_023930839.1 CCA tRNA nucleotidyltransferase 1, mitochondrial isoform X1 [Lingula anatina]|eukprot:XP_013392340.1 CCA tRNA nucleotidyltransferase 1, mitochondrial isoform X1 [Lingula anatina]
MSFIVQDMFWTATGVSRLFPRTTQIFKSWSRIASYSQLSNFKKKGKLKTMKIDTPEFRALFTPELLKLESLFKSYQYELRIAGGAVRDLLMGKTPHDVDFATTATPEEMKTMFEKEKIRMINAKGEEHGTITARINDKENYEVTTLRIDVVTDGRRAKVEFTRDWQLDANRRDLTVNSMFLGFDGTLYDYFNGKEDLEQRRVKFVGNAEERIQEDYLRILRYFRFFGRIATDPNCHLVETLEAIKNNGHGLKGISGERIWTELQKIVVGNHAPSIMGVMADLGLLQYMGLPSDCNLEEFKNVYASAKELDPKPMTMVTALLHKEEDIYQFRERVKFSNDDLGIALFVQKHRRDQNTQDKIYYCKELLCDTEGSVVKTKEKICELLKYFGNKELLSQPDDWNIPRFPVHGQFLVKMGLKKREIAVTLAALRKLWKESGFTLSQDELLEHAEKMVKDGDSSQSKT